MKTYSHSSCHRHLLHRCHPRHLILALPPFLLAIALWSFFLFGGHLWDVVPQRLGSLLIPSSSAPWSPSTPAEKARRSPFSFDLPGTDHAAWMADAPDAWSLARLALPGTHDTLTHGIDHLGYRCQNSPLGIQLAAGLRYFDVRARVQVQPGDRLPTGPREQGAVPRHKVLGIYHANAYTGYELGDVLETVFGFLEAHPSETVVIRLKEEGPPVNGSVDDAPGPKQFAKVAYGLDEQGRSPFEAALEHYREEDPRTERGFAERVYQWSEAGGAAAPEPVRVPTVGEARGKVLFLQEFPYFPAEVDYRHPDSPHTVTYYGIPWAVSSRLLEVEDDWIMDNLTTLARKWTSIRTNLQAAALASRGEGDESQKDQKLFLSHLSASVGVLPIDAAAGPADGSVAGMNDQTGRWLVAGDDASDGLGAARRRRPAPPQQKGQGAPTLTPVGIVIADFPGRQLVDAILRRNSFVQ